MAPPDGRPLRVMAIVGTRPDAIKMAPVIRALGERRLFHPVVVSTGQHREMLQQILGPFGIRPRIDLNIMHERQSLNDIVAAASAGLARWLADDRPDMILVQGDTTTAFVGALTAFNCGVPVGHVEAGLRTYDNANPFPEEANRRLISVLTDLHFAPTSRSGENLLREGVPPARVVVTGNTGIDCLFDALRLRRGILSRLVPVERLAGRRLVLVTAHRRENWDDGLANICRALREAVRLHADVTVLFPVHLNPIVRQAVYPILGASEQVLLVDPLPYAAFVEAMERAYIILTDSGGVQEEAPALGKPVLVARDKTERPEAVAAGAARLVGTAPGSIVGALRALLEDRREYAQMARRRHLYGDGEAARRVADAIQHFFGRGTLPLPFIPDEEGQVSYGTSAAAA